jgi:hypothetical protein
MPGQVSSKRDEIKSENVFTIPNNCPDHRNLKPKGGECGAAHTQKTFFTTYLT